MPRSILNHARVDDHELGLNHSANISIAIGPDAAPLHVDKSVGHNTYIGRRVAVLVGAPSSDEFNTAIGSEAMAANTGTHNTIMGHDVLSISSTARQNTAIGYKCMNNCTGNFNTSVGYQGMRNSTGDLNTSIGYLAGRSIENGNSNIAVGMDAIGDVNSAQCTCDSNICIGNNSGSDLTSGSGNIVIGS